jgi:hypothetical protein
MGDRQDDMEFRQQARKYWQIIRWNATNFLTGHEGYASRLFRERIAPNLIADLAHVLRFVAGGMLRFLLGFSASLLRARSRESSRGQPYLLLITVGQPKYAWEERQMIEVCREKALGVRVAYTTPISDAQSDCRPLSIASALTPADHLRSLWMWMWELGRGLPGVLSRDARERSLRVATIPGIWHYYLHVALARRIVEDHGKPLLVLSLLPSAAASVTVVEYMKAIGVLTASIRTQTTSQDIEHLAINSDILFYKSQHERHCYEEVLGGEGPRLEEGCLLSMPESYQLDPLPLPSGYTLLLGTAPTSDQDADDYQRFNERVFQVGRCAGLPLVFKGHNLAEKLDEAWFAARPAVTAGCVRITDIRRNRELIDGAALVVSAPSTLLYYAIACRKPIIMVDSKVTSTMGTEFEAAPITRIAWQEAVAMDGLDWNVLQDSCRAAKSWFEENYYLQKGPDFLVELLLGSAWES